MLINNKKKGNVPFWREGCVLFFLVVYISLAFPSVIIQERIKVPLNDSSY